LQLSADDATLYVVSGDPFRRNGANALVVFQRNRQDGRLSFLQVLTDGVAGVDGLAGASEVTVFPDDSTVAVAAPDDNALSLFTRDPQSGLLTFDRVARDGTDGAYGLAGAASVSASQDSRFLYVAASVDNALTVFRVYGALCPGDCSADHAVTIDELLLCVTIALGTADISQCGACEADALGTVDVVDLTRAVASAVSGCP
jgi:hypothetical protein